MKYLYLIIRHFFPKKKWTVIRKINVFDEYLGDMPAYCIYVLQDQFGNIKKKKI